MNEGQIVEIANRYQGADVNTVFTEPRLLIHTEQVEGLGEYELHISKPLAGVGGRLPKWRVEVIAKRPDGTVETLNDGKAHAPWHVMAGIVAESLAVMAYYIEQDRGAMIKARRSGMRAI